MGLFDFLLNEEQRLKNEARQVEKEARILEARLTLKKANDRKDKIQKQLDDENTS